MKRLLLFLFLGMSLLTPAFSLQPEVKVSPQSLNFGHEGSEKTLYITNTSPNSDLFWSVKSTAPWLKVEPATGHIENPSRIPADDAPYSYSDMWPKLPQPWYFLWLWSVGVDHEGSVYALEKGRIKKFNKYGEFVYELISPLKVGTEEIYLADKMKVTFDASDNFYVAGGGRILKFNKEGVLQLVISEWAEDIAIAASGNIYVTAGAVVKKLDKDGKLIKTWGKAYSQGDLLNDGEFLPSYDAGLGIAVDSREFVYVADNHFHRIQKFDSEGNFIKTWGLSDKGYSSFREPVGDWQLGNFFAIDAHDVIWIGHEHSCFLKKFDTEGNSLPVDWKEELAHMGNNYFRDGTVTENGEVYFAYRGVWKVGNDGAVSEKWESYKLGLGLRWPNKILTDAQGNIFVYETADWGKIKLFSPTGELKKEMPLSQYFEPATINNEKVYLNDTFETLALTKTGNISFIDKFVEWNQDRTDFKLILAVLEYDIIGKSVSATPLRQCPYHVIKDFIYDSTGNIYLSGPLPGNSTEKNIIACKFDKAGNLLKKYPSPGETSCAGSLALDSKDNLLIFYGCQPDKIGKISPEGELLWQIAVSANDNPREDYIYCCGNDIGRNIVMDKDDNIYIIRSEYNEVRKYDITGQLLAKWGKRGWQPAEFLTPVSIALGPQGDIYTLEYLQNRIQVFSRAVQSLKVTVERSQLYAPTNTANIEIYDDRNPAQPIAVIPVTALTETYPVGSMMINKGNAYTNSRSVRLSFSVTDAESGMGPGAKMRFSNDNVTWSDAEDYAASKRWTLTSGEGIKTVYATFANAVGNWSKSPASATIIYERTPCQIKHASISQAAYNQELVFNAEVSDALSGVSQVNLVYYKRRGMQWGMIGKEEITVEMNFVNGLYQARFKPKTLDIGRYGYYIQTQDNAGNWKSTPVYSLTVTTKKP